MKKSLLILALGVLFFTGCTVKQVVAPQGASYEQQQQSFDKASKELE